MTLERSNESGVECQLVDKSMMQEHQDSRRSAEEGSPPVADGFGIQCLVGDRIEPQYEKAGPLVELSAVGPFQEMHSIR